MAAVKCGLRRVRPVMATRQLRIYFFLPSSSSSTPFQCFLHPKSSFHSLSSSSYLCLQPKPSSLSSSSSSHSFLSSSSSSSSFSHCFLHPKSSFHSVSSIHPPSIHPPFLHSQTRLLTLHSSHHSCSLSVSPHLFPLASLPPLSSPSTSLHPSPFSTSPLSHKTRTKVEGVTPEGKKKHRPDKAELVTLIDAEDKVSVVSLENAERLAKRRDLKLVKVEDVNLKGDRKAYKLMTGKQYFEKEMKAKKSEKKTSVGGKDEKILVIGGKITPHDLGVKLHSLTKWLSKGHQIKVTISSRKATKEDVENVFSTIEEEVKKVKARVMQRHEKVDDIRFYIVPPKDESAASSEASTDDHIQSEDSDKSPGHAKGGVQ